MQWALESPDVITPLPFTGELVTGGGLDWRAVGLTGVAGTDAGAVVRVAVGRDACALLAGLADVGTVASVARPSPSGAPAAAPPATPDCGAGVAVLALRAPATMPPLCPGPAIRKPTAASPAAAIDAATKTARWRVVFLDRSLRRDGLSWCTSDSRDATDQGRSG